MRTITKTSGAEALRATGKRLTRARRLILDVVRASEAHPSAAMVYRDVRRRLPRVSLATVYRNLRMLAAEGLLTERADTAGMRFDGNTADHDHFTCVTCGRIYDVPAAGAHLAVALAPVPAGFDVLSRRTEFYGRCGRCQRRQTALPTTHSRRGKGNPARVPLQKERAMAGRSLKGSKSLANLKDAFAGESQANRRYLYFARVADIEGFPDIPGLFRDTAEAETGHAFGHLDFLKEVGDPATGEPMGKTEANLKASAAGETYEYTQMYPGMAKTAREEGFAELAEWFETLA